MEQENPSSHADTARGSPAHPSLLAAREDGSARPEAAIRRLRAALTLAALEMAARPGLPVAAPAPPRRKVPLPAG